MSTVQGGQGNIVTNGLILNLDAANPRSYAPPFNGTTWQNLVAVSSSISGSLVNGVGYTGSNNGALVFDGVDDFINMGTSPALQPSSITFCIWVKRTTTWGAGSCLFWAKPNAAYDGTGFYVEPVSPSTSNYTSVVCNGFPNYFQLQVDGNTTFTLNIPIYFCFTLSGGVGAIYINGISKPIVTTGTPSITSTSDPKYIMSNSPGYAITTPGTVYITQIYNRALNASEVLQNFNATRARFGV